MLNMMLTPLLGQRGLGPEMCQQIGGPVSAFVFGSLNRHADEQFDKKVFATSGGLSGMLRRVRHARHEQIREAQLAMRGGRGKRRTK